MDCPHRTCRMGARTGCHIHAMGSTRFVPATDRLCGECCHTGPPPKHHEQPGTFSYRRDLYSGFLHMGSLAVVLHLSIHISRLPLHLPHHGASAPSQVGKQFQSRVVGRSYRGVLRVACSVASKGVDHMDPVPRVKLLFCLAIRIVWRAFQGHPDDWNAECRPSIAAGNGTYPIQNSTTRRGGLDLAGCSGYVISSS